MITWSLKLDIIEKEKALDGCYVIRTDADKESIKKDQAVEGYRNLQKIKQAFRNMKTVMLELRPVYHKTDERIKAHIFIVMLAYYLQWHAAQKLKPLFDMDGFGKDKRWTFATVIERLKSIRKIENTIDGIVVKKNVSMPDLEQKRILDLMEVKLA